MPEYLSFETHRLLLEPASESDADFMLELMNTPGWLRYIGDRQVKNCPGALRYIQHKVLPQFNLLGYGSYTVRRKSDQEKLGSCGLYQRTGLSGIDLGFAFLPQYQGRGYAQEAATELIRAAREVFSLPRLKAITTPDNQASRQLLSKLGFRVAGTTRLPPDKTELLLYLLYFRDRNKIGNS